MPPRWDDMQTALAQWLEGRSPVTFYDVLALIRPAQRADWVPDAIVRGLVALHAAPHITPGARDVLTLFLRGEADRQARERDLAQRPLTFADRNRTARLRCKQTLTVELQDRANLGLQWELIEVGQRIEVKNTPDPLRPDVVLLVVRAKTAGMAHLRCTETTTDHRESRERREFLLHVFVEDAG